MNILAGLILLALGACFIFPPWQKDAREALIVILYLFLCMAVPVSLIMGALYFFINKPL